MESDVPATRITIFDTTLRDGEQAPGFSMNESQKLVMARKLEELGVDVIEAGFPVASGEDFRAVAAIAREVRGASVAALARAVPADLERAAAALDGAARPRLHTFIASSDLHLEKKLGMTRAEAVDASVRAVEWARERFDDVEFSCEDATRSDTAFLVELVTAAVEAGATTINLPDTTGYATPEEICRMFRAMQERVPGAADVVFSAHCHNDLGMAVANSISAIRAGARQVECTVNGCGERAGNAAMEELVMALKVRRDVLPYTTGIRTPQFHAASRLLSELTGEPVQANKAIVGRNAFAHEAGIHQHGLLQDRRTYEIMKAEDVGVPQPPLVLGRHSGRHALKARCEALGLDLTRQELDRLYREMLRRAQEQRRIDDADLLELAGALHPLPESRPPAEELGYGFGV